MYTCNIYFYKALIFASPVVSALARVRVVAPGVGDSTIDGLLAADSSHAVAQSKKSPSFRSRETSSKMKRSHGRTPHADRVRINIYLSISTVSVALFVFFL